MITKKSQFLYYTPIQLPTDCVAFSEFTLPSSIQQTLHFFKPVKDNMVYLPKFNLMVNELKSKLFQSYAILNPFFNDNHFKQYKSNVQNKREIRNS